MIKKKGIDKQYWPILLLVAVVISSCFYYLFDGVWNDFGQTKPEWIILIDGLLVLPLFCFYCIEDKNKATVKAFAYACLMVLLGSYLIPDANKYVWSHIEAGRFVVVGLFVVFEIITVLTVFIAIKSSLNQVTDPDLAISEPIESLLGSNKLAKLMSFEARVWVYAFFPNRVQALNFRGDQHFYGHLKDGTQSNLLGFILVILFGLPLEHLLLHFIWSPLAANVITGLAVFGMLFLVAEYRAISRRPVSIDSLNQQLIIRYGLFAPLIIPFNQITSIDLHDAVVNRAKHVKRYNQFGNPNVAITTSDGQHIYLGLNNPQKFIETIKQ